MDNNRSSEALFQRFELIEFFYLRNFFFLFIHCLFFLLLDFFSFSFFFLILLIVFIGEIKPPRKIKI